MQISFGTQWDVVSRGCTGCIKINFATGVVWFLAVHYGADLLKRKMKFCHGFQDIWSWITDYENLKVFFYGMVQLFAHYISC